MKNRLNIILYLAICILFYSLSVTAAAVDETAEGTDCFTLEEVLNQFNIDCSADADIYLDYINVYTESSLTETAAALDDGISAVKIPAIIVKTDNQDGTVTSEIITAVTVDLLSGETFSNLTAVSEDAVTVSVSNGSYSAEQAGYLVYMAARYYEVSLYDYEAYGYAYSPRTSRFCVTNQTDTDDDENLTLSDCAFYTFLGGYWTRSADDPSEITSYDVVIFENIHEIGIPVSGRYYAYDDYASFCDTEYMGEDYSDDLVCITSGGEGSYFLKCDLSMEESSYTYIFEYGIYNRDSGEYIS